MSNFTIGVVGHSDFALKSMEGGIEWSIHHNRHRAYYWSFDQSKKTYIRMTRDAHLSTELESPGKMNETSYKLVRLSAAYL